MKLMQKTIDGIRPLDEGTMDKAKKRMDSLIKPIGSLGRLEEFAVQIAGITGNVNNTFEKKCTIVMAADNGICEEGVSSAPQSLTAVQSINFTKGIAAISVLSKHAGADIAVVDIGIKGELADSKVISRKVSYGTKNMVKEPAMTREQAIKAVETGIEIASDLIDSGCKLLGTGEMGIGNTSTSSAMLMVLTGAKADEVVGKGAGLTEEDFEKKKRAIEKAISINNPQKDDVIDVLAKVGGLDIAGLAGCYLAAAEKKVPIVIDGFISVMAALTAYKLNPLARDYMIPSHCSDEPGYKKASQALGLESVLNLHMRLGEGTGCPLMFNIIEASQAVMANMATFDEAALENDYLVDIR
ncbi:MAG: nicotinate-nucleotide--dimethylbenzimidazole phosphoribosyltransferase [Clostridia bacterium]|jgi:nicotinate-nucleotide--dimethylbenzimidazole phosphoribosyltransferase|nr:nicotinate-nucleotide--dimethylbenzimidazole phosphoribosyltransferase [Clostridia bacterium]